MKSIAIWYKPKAESNIAKSISLHFNLWKLPTKKQTEFNRFLDVGFFIEQASQIEEIQIFIPHNISSRITDLGKIIAEDTKLLSAVFNDNLSIKAETGSNFYEVTGQEIGTFHIYALGDCNITKNTLDDNKGCIIKLQKLNTDIKERIYLRIRILDECIKKFSLIEELSNAFIQNAFSKIETIDFRLNEIREIDSKVLEEYINTTCFFNISKAHFFYMCSSKEETIFANRTLTNCRHLEKNRWQNYIRPQSITNKDVILAHHWKYKPTNDEHLNGFSLLIKSKFESRSWKNIGKYFCGLLAIAILTTVIIKALSIFFCWILNLIK